MNEPLIFKKNSPKLEKTPNSWNRPPKIDFRGKMKA